MNDFMFYALNGAVIGTLYALSATGVALTVGLMGVINFAHGEFFVLAAYVSHYFAAKYGLGWMPSLIIAVGTAFLLGVLIERVMLRTKYPDPIFSLIATFVFSIVLQNSFLLVFGPYPVTTPTLVEGTFDFGPFTYARERLMASFLAIAILLFLFWMVKATQFGRALRASAQDRGLAELLGINTKMINSVSFGLGCALAGAAGTILSAFFPVTPTVGSSVSLTAFVVIVLGGMGSLRGCVTAALLLGIIENLGAAYVSTAYRQFFGFTLLVLTLTFRPEGLYGRKQTR